MITAATKLPVNKGTKEAAPPPAARVSPLETLRNEIDRLFDDFPSGFLRSPFRRPAFDVEPFWRREWAVGAIPAVDIVEKDKAYEVTAELPGMDEKSIEVKFSEGMLTIRGEKEETKEEKEKDYHLSERRYGSFQRTFGVPDGVDASKIEATFSKGVLTVVLPKSAEAQKAEKKIAVKAK